MIDPKTLHEYEEKILQLIDTRDAFTRSDLQGLVSVVVMEMLRETKDPEGIYKYLDCSTGHVTEKDMKLLEDSTPDLPMMTAVYPEGAWVSSLHYAEEAEAEEDELKQLGFSGAFLQVLAFAREKGCKYVCLDRDAEIYDELEQFEW